MSLYRNNRAGGGTLLFSCESLYATVIKGVESPVKDFLFCNIMENTITSFNGAVP